MSIEIIKSIRARTGLSLKDIRKAVDALDTTDEDKIIEHMREQGLLKTQARADRETNQGGIFSYIHDGRIGVMLEVKCETDFVARSDNFKAFADNICLHLAAYQPKFVSTEEVSEEFIAKELEIAKEQLKNEGKPEDKIDMILQGKKKKIEEESSLLSQAFVKDPSKSVSDVLTEVSQETGEKIIISRFVIYSLNS